VIWRVILILRGCKHDTVRFETVLLHLAVTLGQHFVQVRGEDFSSYISKLSTPRELMIMMTEMLSRIEANPEGGLTGQVGPIPSNQTKNKSRK
jgi:hypothetical protein